MAKSYVCTDSARVVAGVPDGITGRGVCVALLGSFFPAHKDILSKKNCRVVYVDLHGAAYDPQEATRDHPDWGGQHDLGVAARAGGTGESSGGVYAGVAPECDFVLCSRAAKGGADDLETGDEQLKFAVENVDKYGIRVLVIGRKGYLTGPLVPWQWDGYRRRCEELTAKGVLVVSGTGNVPLSFCPQSLSPSALSVGGVTLPDERSGAMSAFHSPEGPTFEGKWVPEVLAPAEPLIVPSLDADHQCGLQDVPVGHAVVEGTSYAAPFIAGLAACLMQAHPQASARALARAFARAAKRAELRFGKADVGIPTFLELECALEEVEGEPYDRPPFETYQPVQSMDWGRRITLMKESPAKAREVVLNSIPQIPPGEYVEHLREAFRTSEDPRLRAGVLFLLAPNLEDEPNRAILDAALEDASPLVLGSALDLMRRHAPLAASRKDRLAGLINHPDPRVRHEACLVVKCVPDARFIRPLIEGMEADLEGGNIGVFFDRRLALKEVTGQTYWPRARKRMLPGECVLSDYWLRKQRECMRNWQRKLGMHHTGE